jgi:hypothetical protein
MQNFSDIKKSETKSAPQTEETAPTQEKQPEVYTEKKSRLSWRAPEYVYYEKSTDWFWALGIITATLLAIAAYQQSFVFLLLIIVGAFGILIYAVRKPVVVDISISGEGVRVADRLFLYENLKSFWIFYRPGDMKILSIESGRALIPHIHIPLGSMNPVDVRALLLEFLPEKAQEESLSDSIARWIRF